MASGAPATLSLYDPQLAQDAAAQTMYFPVTRTGDAGYDVFLNYATSDGTAIAGVDYLAASGTAFIAAQTAGIFLPVTIQGSASGSGPSVMFSMELASPVGVGAKPAFGNVVDYPRIGAAMTEPQLADIDGDGKADLVYIKVNSIAVRLNSTAPGATSPTFLAEQTFIVGGLPQRFAFADINGDGRLDIVVTEGFDSTVSVLLNTTPIGAATSTFAARTSFATGSQPFALAVGDVNGDGRPDIAVTNLGSDTVSVLINTTPAGAAIASFAAQNTVGSGQYLASVALADINGDGHSDLIVGDTLAFGFHVLVNSTIPGASVATFGPDTVIPCNNGSLVQLVDLNRDGKLDLVTEAGQGVNICVNTTPAGSSTPTFSAPQNFLLDGFPQSIAVADLNDDGLPDIASASYSQGKVSILRNITPPGSTTPALDAFADAPMGNGPDWISVGDLNGDGRVDLAISNGQDGSLSVAMNTTTLSAPVPTFQERATFASRTFPFQVATADFNGDGLADVATIDYTGNSVTVLVNTRAATSAFAQFSQPYDFAAGSNTQGMSSCDFNRDGKPDIVVANAGTQQVSVLLNTTTPGASVPTFAPRQVLAAGIDLGSDLVTMDLNGDGTCDVVASGYSSGTRALSVFFNTTSPGASSLTFLPPQILNNLFFVAGAVADMNGDGTPDIVYVYPWGSVLFNTTTPGTFSASFSTSTDSASTLGAHTTATAIGDFNGDGRPDVAALSEFGALVLFNAIQPGTTTAKFGGLELGGGGGQGYSIVAADFTGDGRADVVMSDPPQLFVNTTAPGATTPSFAQGQSIAEHPDEYNLVAVADVTGDGHADLVGVGNGTLSVFANTTWEVDLARATGTGTILHDTIFSDGFE